MTTAGPIQKTSTASATVVGDCISTFNNLAPDFELSFNGFQLGSGVENVQCKGSSSEFTLIDAMTAKFDDRIVAVGDDIGTAETRGLSHGSVDVGKWI